MLVVAAVYECLSLAAASLAQARLGVLGLVLFCAMGVGIRARNNTLAVGAAAALVALMIQA
ncbi:hypothetical protein [Streptomyces longwoodensis]|uniref:hypothetical protein n=1 Tax=Streptomyces longwoodensis TaxID=68231 RepID=UPI0033F88E7E